VDTSVRRILAVKLRYHLLPGPPPLGPALHEVASVGADADLPRPTWRVSAAA
jgi:hypothetical protein